MWCISVMYTASIIVIPDNYFYILKSFQNYIIFKYILSIKDVFILANQDIAHYWT